MLLLLPLFFAAPALAAPSQDNDDPPAQRGGITSVPAVNGRGWNLSAGVTTRFDTNLRRRDGGAQGWRVTPLVQGSIGMPIGRQQVFLGANIGRDYLFGDDKLPNRTRFAVGGGVNWRLGRRCNGQVAADYRENLALFSELAVLEDNTQSTRTVGGNFSCQVGGALGITGGITNTDLTNSRPAQRLFNNRGTTFNAGLTYGRPTLGQFSLSGSLDTRMFPDRQVNDGTTGLLVDDGVDVYSARFGYSRGLGSRLNVSLGASYIDVKPKPSSQIVFVPDIGFVVAPRSNFSGPGFDAAITYNSGNRITAGFSASRQVRSSANVGALFIVSSTVAADFDYRLNRSLTAGFGGSYLDNSYRGSVASGAETRARIKDNLWRVYGQINYTPIRMVTVGLEVAHQRRTSNPADFSFRSTTVLLNLRANFGRSS
ncbi:outer membrane beta-barrel protein [Sandarakinorhabdus sp.]|uniref:outer membrane beta-barrel protein n=1 Tax=Sandarakinorhabdus sp. TaxID=1916663 RepID=UPI00286DA00B|nr:outer membrane beta-barrel protein [Sandarakinorhabdus sp.]